jgi:hypothetical protein
MTDGRPFVECINVAGAIIELPSLSEWSKLELRLLAGSPGEFSLSRQSDRDSAMEFEWSDGRFAIVGCEDSLERGSFGFCLLKEQGSDDMRSFGIQAYPDYCTTSDLKLVAAVARTWFEFGELTRSVSWFVGNRNIGRKRDQIIEREIYAPNGTAGNLLEFLRERT